MAAPVKLSDAEIAAALTTLDGWSVVQGKLHRELKFGDFAEAFGFMTRVAIEANTMWHHPEWSNVWSKVVIDLVTHDIGNAISDLDLKLAKKINAILAE